VTRRGGARAVGARAFLGALVVLLAVAAMVVVLQVGADDDKGSRPGQSALPDPAGVQAVPELEQRQRPATAYTKDGLFVFGGEREVPGPAEESGLYIEIANDGAIVEPGTTKAQAVPSPFDPPIGRPAAVATGDLVVVIGIECRISNPVDPSAVLCPGGTYAAAAYDTSSGAWSRLKLPEALASYVEGGSEALGSTSDGRAIFKLGGLWSAAQYWTYQPATDEWSRLPDPPIRPEGECLLGDQLVVVTARYRNLGDVLDDDPRRAREPGKIYNGGSTDGWVEPSLALLPVTEPDKGWRRTSSAGPTETAAVTPPDATCMGNAVFVADRTTTETAYVYDVGSTQWTKATPAPIPGPALRGVWTGKELVFLPGIAPGERTGAAFDPANGTWRLIRNAPGTLSQAAWTGETLVGYSERSYQSPPGGADSAPPVEYEAGTFSFPVGT